MSSGGGGGLKAQCRSSGSHTQSTMPLAAKIDKFVEWSQRDHACTTAVPQSPSQGWRRHFPRREAGFMRMGRSGGCRSVQSGQTRLSEEPNRANHCIETTKLCSSRGSVRIAANADSNMDPRAITLWVGAKPQWKSPRTRKPTVSFSSVQLPTTLSYSTRGSSGELRQVIYTQKRPCRADSKSYLSCLFTPLSRNSVQLPSPSNLAHCSRTA